MRRTLTALLALLLAAAGLLAAGAGYLAGTEDDVELTHHLIAGDPAAAQAFVESTGLAWEPVTDAELAAREQENAGTDTLESLCGVNYRHYIVETITMQMENRMEKSPEVVYFPIQEDRPLTDYVAIDETTAFTLDEDGNIIISFPAGSVTDASNGEQTFRLPQP